MTLIWSAQRRKDRPVSALQPLRLNPVYVPLLLAVAWKLVECVGLIGEQEGLCGGSVPTGLTSFGADLGGRLEGVHGAPNRWYRESQGA
jgi:hypothetical protein